MEVAIRYTRSRVRIRAYMTDSSHSTKPLPVDQRSVWADALYSENTQRWVGSDLALQGQGDKLGSWERLWLATSMKWYKHRAPPTLHLREPGGQQVFSRWNPEQMFNGIYLPLLCQITTPWLSKPMCANL